MRALPAGRAHAAVLILTFFGTLLALLATSRYGVGLTPDSAGYVGTARSLLAGNGFTYWTGEPFVAQPPLFPLLLALLGSITHSDPILVARFLNATLFAATIYAAGFWFLRHMRSRLLAVVGAAAVAFSVPLLRVATMAWSEALFVLLSLLFLIRLGRYLQNRDRSALLACALCAGLGLLTRYLGITLVMTGVVGIMLARDETVRRRLRHAALFAGLSVAPTVVWCVRNLVVSSTLMGERAPSLFSLKTNAWLTAETIAGWFLHPRMLATPALALLAALALAAFAFAYFRASKSRSGASGLGLANHPVALFLCFAALYLAFLLLSATKVAFDTLDYRLLSPVYVPLLCVLLFGIDAVAAREWRGRVGRFAPALLKLAMAAWLVYPVTGASAVVRSRIAGGIGYASARWARSPLIGYLRRHPLPGYVVSNNAYLVYALTGRPTHRSPEEFLYNSSVRKPGTLDQFEDKLAAAPDAYLVWLDPAPFRHLYGLEDLRAVTHLSVVRQFPEGTIYHMTVPSRAAHAAENTSSRRLSSAHVR